MTNPVFTYIACFIGSHANKCLAKIKRNLGPNGNQKLKDISTYWVGYLLAMWNECLISAKLYWILSFMGWLHRTSTKQSSQGYILNPSSKYLVRSSSCAIFDLMSLPTTFNYSAHRDRASQSGQVVRGLSSHFNSHIRFSDLGVAKNDTICPPILNSFSEQKQ